MNLYSKGLKPRTFPHLHDSLSIGLQQTKDLRGFLATKCVCDCDNLRGRNGQCVLVLAPEHVTAQVLALNDEVSQAVYLRPDGETL